MSLSVAAPSEVVPTPQAAPERLNLLGLDRRAMEELFVGLGVRPFHAQQVLKWIHHREVSDFAMMTDLSKPLRARLAESTEVATPEVLLDKVAPDGTRKWLLSVSGGNAIETVFIPDGERGTLCVSSQVGCTLNCSFCSTARQGFNRNLSAAEIVGQVYVAYNALRREHWPEGRYRKGDKERLITNVVFMGMGEPLLNFEPVVTACDLIMDDLGYGLGKRRVTVSTSGVVPQIDQLRDRTDVSLAVSLHAPDDALRDKLVPLNRKYPIEQLLAACKRFLAGSPHKRITFEYVMLEGINDSPEQARRLARLLAEIPSKINLIPFNPFPDAGYRRSSDAAIDRFRDILLDKGFMTITRKTRGDEIDAACGQLVGQVRDRSSRTARRLWAS